MQFGFDVGWDVEGDCVMGVYVILVVVCVVWVWDCGVVFFVGVVGLGCDDVVEQVVYLLLDVF